MHSAKSVKLPKHPNWTLDPASRPERGRLTLRYGSNELHIRFWPRASAWLRRTPTSRWQDGARHAGRLLRSCLQEPDPKTIYLYREKHLVDPLGQFLFPFLRELMPENAISETDHALRQALQTIPEAVRESLGQLHRCEWPALEVTSRLRAAAELLPSHPQLFWLWLRRYRLVPQTNPGLTALFCLQFDLQFPRRIQLSKLGFVNAKTWLRILAKAPVRHLHRIDWEALAEASRCGIDPALLKRLRHHPGPIPVALLQTLADANTRRWLSPALLRTSLDNPRYDIHQLLNIYDQFQRVYPSLGGTFKLPTQIDDLEWERRSMERNLMEYPKHRNLRKSSPLPCPEGWTHLDRIEAVTDEGIRQRNCLRENPGGILSGSGHVYRVEQPVRATLHVDHTKGGHWYIRQCAGPRNEVVAPRIQHELLCTLTGRQMPDLKSLPRVTYPTILPESTPLYQRLGNSRALWALHSVGKLALPPDAFEEKLLAGDSVIYRMRHPHECVFCIDWDSDYGWELGSLLYTEARHYRPAHFRVAAHLLWRHYADLHAHGFDIPTWTMPALSLEGYHPVRNIWELLDFCWQTGSVVSLKDILEHGWCPFYCTVEGHDLAVVAIPILDFWEVYHAYAIKPGQLNGDTDEARARKETIERHIIRPFDPIEGESVPRPATIEDSYVPPPRLPELKYAETLNHPNFKRVYL